MRVQSWLCRLGLVVASVAAVAGFPSRAAAQTSTGSIRGYVTDSAGTPMEGARVVAVSVLSGAQREATSQSRGYYALLGLVPGEYDVTARQIGMAPQKIRARVLVGGVYPLDFKLAANAIQLEAVTIAAASGIETRTSEVATNITQKQIEALPTASRNFLDLAALAPGVTVSEDRVNGVGFRTFQGGGSSPNQSNIFVDGTSLKNDLTAGGVSGQDASRGNPFPRNAIQEYRVITQNFKAEYQDAASAIITATTKSGGNKWAGTASFGYQNKGLVTLDTFQIAAKHVADSIAQATGKPSTFNKPDYTRSLVSFSVGGPIQKDKLFFFGAYEGNYQNRDNLISFTPPNNPNLAPFNLTQYNGNFTSPFRESLGFGKLTYNINEKSTLEFSVSDRHETDVRDFGNVNCPSSMCAFQEAVNYRDNVTIGQARYNRFSGAWLNEVKLDYSRFQRNPAPNTPGMVAQVFHYPGQDAQIGSNLSSQDFVQKGFGIRDDITYSGFQGAGQHVFKGGVSVDFDSYDINKRNNETPKFEYAQYVDPNSYGWTTDTTALKFNFRNPFVLSYGTGIGFVSTNNTRVGAYIQDDWSPTPRLTFNLGIRWDFETNMINTSYVTPKEVVDTLTRYVDSMPAPHLDLSRYISTGSNRSPFYGAFQPRIGFSYALDAESKTTVFGGFGIFYDRSIFDFSVDEIQKLTHPTYTIRFADPDSAPKAGQVAWSNTYLTTDTATLNALVHTSGLPEAFLLDNKMKPPKSTQWNLGVRRVLGAWVGAVTYQGQRGTNLFTYNWANFGLQPNGSCVPGCPGFNIGAHGFANIIYSTNDGKTWYDAVTLQFDRPYRRSSDNFGWGGGVQFTYARRSIAGVDNLNDITSSFPGGFPRAVGIPKHSDNGGNDERQRIVANWVMDMPYLLGIQFGGLLTLGSGARLDIGCAARFCGPGTYVNGGFTPPVYNGVIPGGWAYRRIDLKFRKDFPPFSGTQLGATLDLFNIFNFQNFGCYDVGFNSPTQGHSTCLLSDPRRVQLGAEYSF
ncbi:MAG TPA: carboxypeptidase regulatory-like domain-containing protein [Gemmatimonadales bacterium]|nr:carboxypeptidase regulatory-like domain-containing protein [Gemmatimonadales bacterium]